LLQVSSLERQDILQATQATVTFYWNTHSGTYLSLSLLCSLALNFVLFGPYLDLGKKCTTTWDAFLNDVPETDKTNYLHSWFHWENNVLLQYLCLNSVPTIEFKRFPSATYRLFKEKFSRHKQHFSLIITINI
jgi:hypothetical protein